MTQVRIKRTKDDKSPIIVSYSFGDTLAESAAKFDGDSPLDKVVHGLFVSAAKAQLQDFVRKLIAPTVVVEKVPAEAKGKKATTVRKEVPSTLSLEDIQAKVNDWKPTVEKASKRAVSAAKKVVDGLSPAQKAELLKLLGDQGGDDQSDEPHTDDEAERAAAAEED